MYTEYRYGLVLLVSEGKHDACQPLVGPQELPMGGKNKCKITKVDFKSGCEERDFNATLRSEGEAGTFKKKYR